MALVGYFFGAAAEAAAVDVRRYAHWIICGIFLVAAVVWIVYFFRKRRKDPAELP